MKPSEERIANAVVERLADKMMEAIEKINGANQGGGPTIMFVDDGPKDLHDELHAYMNVVSGVANSAVEHGFAHFIDNEHNCDPLTFDTDDSEEWVEFSGEDVKAYLAFEDATVKTMVLVRKIIRGQGYALPDVELVVK